jgi:hypothetical protein
MSHVAVKGGNLFTVGEGSIVCVNLVQGRPTGNLGMLGSIRNSSWVWLLPTEGMDSFQSWAQNSG